MRKAEILTPYYLKRVAGMPYDKLPDLIAYETLALIGKIRDTEHILEEIKIPIFKLIYDNIENTKSSMVRDKLIAIKKTIHKRKEVSMEKEICDQMISKEIIICLKKWNDKLSAFNKLMGRYPVVYENELNDIRLNFQKVVDNENLLNGILLTSQIMYEKTKKYISTPIKDQKSRLRKIEPALSTFLIRTACKTSPFSTFTSTAIGDWAEHKFSINESENRTESYYKINYSLVMRIFEYLLAHEEVMQFCSYIINPTTKIKENTISYIMNDDRISTSSKIYRMNEKQVQITDNDFINNIIKVIKTKSSLTYNELLSLIKSYFGSEKESKDFINKIYQIQLILPTLHLYEQSDNIIDEFITKISNWDVPVVKSLIELLKQLNENIDQYSNAELNKKNNLLSKLKNTVRAIAELLNIPFSDKIVNNILYEDSIILNEAKESKSEWDPVLKSIKLLQKISPLFDVRFRYQSAVADLFVKKYGHNGVCDNIEEFLHQLTPLFNEYIKTINPGYDPEFGKDLNHIQKVNELKIMFFEEFITKSKDGKDVFISEDDINRYYDNIPKEFKSRTISHSFFLQKFKSKHSDLAVLNQVYLGYTEFFSRFLSYYSPEIYKELKKHLGESIFGSDGTTVEISSSPGFNANLHPEMGEYELKMLSYHLARDTNKQININDLILFFDKNTKRVVFKHKKIGKIYPFYIGYLTPFYLPKLQKHLIHLFQSGFIGLPFHTYNELNLKDTEEEDIRKYGRIIIDNLILQRKKWIIPRKYIISIQNISDDEYFFRIQNWANENGIPTKFFFRMIPTNFKKIDSNAQNDKQNSDEESFKPLYMDLGNPLFCKMFRKVTSNSKYGIHIEEALPDISSPESEKENFVNEYIIELTQKN
ncbi:lantibiotic dehydratase [Bacillus velezensis]|uniref:lantibiotic dehydratase n=2 Tax=Bacillus velezensis TaxID=492670 RepID=UPI00391AE384